MEMRHALLSMHRGVSRRDGDPVRPSWAVRWRGFRSRWRIDRELAAGAACDATAEHAWRARQLSDRAQRRELGVLLRAVLDDWQAGRGVRRLSAAPLCHDSIASCAEALLGLAERLERADAVDPRGVARVRVLLTDGAGPLYNPRSERSLQAALWWIADGLLGVEAGTRAAVRDV